MAAKVKKRSSENKLLKLDKLELKDVICPICQSILIEPVTLPCFHDFCQSCFNGSIENNAVCCPLCRLRIGSWLRTTTKQNKLVNLELWNFIKCKFYKEIQIKLRGEDIELPDGKPVVRLSAPEEIRLDYESELERLKAGRLAIENKHLKETEELIKKQVQQEEAHQCYMKSLKQDEVLAQQIEEQNVVQTPNTNMPVKTTKTKIDPTKVDICQANIKTPVCKSSPLLTDENSSGASTPKAAPAVRASRPSPQMIPSYGKILKSLIDKKLKFGTRFWNKESGDKKTEPEAHCSIYDAESLENSCTKKKNGLKSLVVSLPLPPSGAPQRALDNSTDCASAPVRAGSADSMRQELCYFKPIERTRVSNSTCKGFPVRVPCVRVWGSARPPPPPSAPPPSCAQYLRALCRLRRASLAAKTSPPSAFVIAPSILKDNSSTNSLSDESKNITNSRDMNPVEKKNSVKQMIKNDSHSESVRLGEKSSLKRTRSTANIKDETEATPKKTKTPNRRTTSDKKPYLRSDSRKMEYEKRLSTSPLIPNNINKHRVELAVKKLSSSPLQNNDFNKILQNQLRIKNMIKQEKSDLAIAKKMEAEWNGRRQSTRNVVKRQVSFHYSLRPAKKIEV